MKKNNVRFCSSYLTWKEILIRKFLRKILNNKVYLRKIKLIFHYMLGIWEAAAAVSGKIKESQKKRRKIERETFCSNNLCLL